MPKIKDLGINTIPMTMRPPEIGPGGGFDNTVPPGYQYFAGSGCPRATCGPDEGGGSGCPQASCAPGEQSGCPEASCAPGEQSGCPEASCGPGEQSGCPDATCENPCSQNPSPNPRNASAFHPDAIAQLRQQLDSQLGI